MIDGRIKTIVDFDIRLSWLSNNSSGFFPKDVFESRCLTVLSNPDLLWMDVKILYFYDINTRMVKDTRFIKLFSLIPVVDARGK